MEIKSDTNGQYWVAVCPRTDCTFRVRGVLFTEVEEVADTHEDRHVQADRVEHDPQVCEDFCGLHVSHDGPCEES